MKVSQTRASVAFTLIELLIVVAIIAILAAIAVPNFLEAQTRSKVSRALADMRSITTAVEAYFVDHNAYPPNNALNPADPMGLQFNWKGILIPLSTPVSYISDSHLPEPFGNTAHEMDQWVYQFTNLDESEGVVQVIMINQLGMTEDEVERVTSHRYFISCVGPDRIGRLQYYIQTLGTPIPAFEATINELLAGTNIYDPTNGTTSSGDIYRSQKGIVGGPL